MIFIISLAVFILVAICSYIFFVQTEINEYELQLLSLCNIPISKNERINSDVQYELDKYSHLENTSFQIRDKIWNLNFFIPSKPQKFASGDDIITTCISVLDEKSLAFSGIEQFVLMAFPPEQMANCLVFAIENIIDHTSMASVESLIALKASILEGAVNVHDPQILAECLKKFSHAVYEHLNHLSHIKSLMEAIKDQHLLNILHSFVNWHTVTNALEPAMHLHQHFNEIAHSWVSHTFNASHEIVHHVDVSLSPEAGGHFPIVTLVFSGVREIRLLNDDKTSIENALKNTALDVTGTGVGALAGGKAGAAAGAAIGVWFGGVGAAPGAAIGGFIGAIGGAMFGRKITDSIKYKPLNEALDNYRISHKAMQDEIYKVATDCVNEIRRTSIVSKRKYYQTICESPALDPSKQEIATIAKRLTDYQLSEIKTLTSLLIDMQKSIYSHLPKYTKIINKFKMRLHELEVSIPSQKLIKENPIVALKLLVSIPSLESETYLSKLTDSIDSLRKSNANFSSMLILWTLNAGNEYKNTIYLILKQFEYQGKIFNKSCADWKEYLASKKSCIDIEKQKLGQA